MPRLGKSSSPSVGRLSELTPRDSNSANGSQWTGESRSTALDSITEIAADLRRFREERNWQRFHTPRNLAVSIAIESGELLEHFQWVREGSAEIEIAERLGAISEELADVVIYAVQLADVLDVSLGEAIESKIALNASRYPATTARGRSTKYTDLPESAEISARRIR